LVLLNKPEIEKILSPVQLRSKSQRSSLLGTKMWKSFSRIS